jgi:hypothetical protein
LTNYLIITNTWSSRSRATGPKGLTRKEYKKLEKKPRLGLNKNGIDWELKNEDFKG